MARTPQELTNYTVEDLAHLAGRLRSYADKYDSVTKSLRDISVSAIGLPNQKSLSLALEQLRRHAAEADAALSRLLDMPPSRNVAEPPLPYITPVGKNKPPVVKPKSESSTKKKAE